MRIWKILSTDVLLLMYSYLMSTNVLGVRIDDVSLRGAVDIVASWLAPENKNLGFVKLSPDHKKYSIYTPNPEFLIQAQDDLDFLKTLNSSDLNIPDGNGLRLSGRVLNTTPGVDLMDNLIRLSSDYGLRIGLLGGQDSVANRLKDCLISKYPKLKIDFVLGDIEVNEYGEVLESKESLRSLYIPEIDILFVAFGANKQEKWIYKNKSKFPVKVYMGVGGSFDYLSGNVKRAPVFMRQLRLEWLFRLLMQPWRIKRQLRLVRFLYLVLKERFSL